MKAVLALGLLIALCASADAATRHHRRPPEARWAPAQRVIVPKGFAVPGWTNEETWQWLYDGSAAAGLG
jgi:hypothetical protein